MKKLSIILAVTLVVISAGVAYAINRVTPSKKMSQRTVSVERFHELDVNSAIEVTYVQTTDNNHTLEISAPDNVIDLVQVKVNSGELSIGFSRSVSFNGSANVKVKIKAPLIAEVSLHGASIFKSTGINIPGHDFEADVTGASKLIINNLNAISAEFDASGASFVKVKKIKARKIEADASGASTMGFEGSCNSAEFEASGASTINASNLKAISGEIDAKGASTVSANIQNAYSIDSNGASTVNNKN